MIMKISVLLQTAFLAESLIAIQSCGQQKNQVVEIFAPETISTGNVYRGSFAPDGKTFYFFKNVTKGQEDYRIFVSKLTGEKWSKPVRLNLGGDYSDLYPSISKDGKRMAFSSYRPAPGDTSSHPNAHLWYVDKEGDDWGTPVFMSAVNKIGYYHSWAEIAPDGKLYFRQTTPDWSLNQTFFSSWNGKEYTTPILFEPVDRWKKWRADVRVTGGSLSPDGKALLLDVGVRNPQTGRGASDIWVSVKKGNEWTAPKPFGNEINGNGYETFHFFSPDGKELYFVRDFDTIYRVLLKEALDSVLNAPAKDSVLSIKYIANEGVLILADDKQILIDGLHREYKPDYEFPSPEALKLLETAAPPYEKINLILVSHAHLDHFHPQSVGLYLKNNAGCKLISSQQVVGEIAKTFTDYGKIKNQIKEITPAANGKITINEEGIRLTILGLKHVNRQHSGVQNLGHLVEINGKKLLHIGDADMTTENFSVYELNKQNIDIAFIPYWYLLSEKGRSFVKEEFDPRHIIAVHVSPAVAKETSDELKKYYPDITVFSKNTEQSFLK